MKEEMYEEEDDDLPRQYRAFAAHLQTASPDMNNRLNAYVTNQVAMANLARQQEIDRLFAEQFPGVAQAAQYQHHQYHGRHNPNPPHMAPLQNYHPVGLGPSYPRERTHSMPEVSPMSPLSSYNHPAFQHYNSHPSPSTRHTSIDGQISSPGDSPAPGSAISRTVSTPITNYSGEDSSAKHHSSGIPVDPSLTLSTLPAGSTDSSFTSKLPAETRMMVGDINDQIVSAMYGGELMGSDYYFGDSQYDMSQAFGQPLSAHDHLSHAAMSFDYPEPQTQSVHLGNPNPTGQLESRSGTPSGNVDWEQWVNQT